MVQLYTSWDDGRKEDIKLANLLLKYKIPAIFFIPNCHTITVEQIKWLSQNGFEIGGHTCTHPQDIKLLPIEEVKLEVNVNKKYLEDIIGKRIEWFCFPRGRHNHLTDYIVKYAGFKYARTTVVGKSEIKNNFIVNTTVHVYNDRKE